MTSTEHRAEQAEKLFNDILGNMGSYAEFGLPSYKEGAIRSIQRAFAAREADLVGALERIATVDMGGGFLGAHACQKVARAALKSREASHG